MHSNDNLEEGLSKCKFHHYSLALLYWFFNVYFYKSIFLGAIISKKMYPTINDCDSKCLALLIHSTYDCAQRSSFITILAQLCFLFLTVESIRSETVFISQLIAGVDDNKFLFRLQQRVGNNNPDKVDIIQTIFSVCEDNCFHKKSHSHATPQ